MQAILPLKISGDWQEHDLERARILVRSIDHFWQGEEFRLVIVARREELGIIRQNISSEKFQIDIIVEDDLLPVLKLFPHSSGWMKQQLIKLAAFKIISGTFFLTLDADLICTKPLYDGRFVVDGRALNDWDKRSVHANWWAGSSDFLKEDLDVHRPGLSVTPQVLSTSICEKLYDRLLELHGNGIWEKFFQSLNGWSEYTLYNIFAEKSGLLNEYHQTAAWVADKRLGLRCWDNFWEAADFENWDPARSFEPNSPGLFMVCQSNTRVPPEKVWNKVKVYMSG